MAFIKKLRLFFLLSIISISTILIFTPGCNESISHSQDKLINIAFETATSIPVNPHIKDRSKAQAKVVETCLELNQPKKALAFAEKIENWQRNLSYANIAFYWAQKDSFEKAKQCLDIASQLPIENQQWRIDRIKEKIIETKNLITNKNENSKTPVEDSFDKTVKVLDDLIAQADFDNTKKALYAYADLYNRIYEQAQKRLQIEEKIKQSWGKLPLFVRIELLMKLAQHSLDHNDNTNALKLVNDAQDFIDNYQWPAKHRISLAAKLACIRFRCGDKAKAKTDINFVFEMFKSQKDAIVDIYRARTLQPIAQAYQLMGDKKLTLLVYKEMITQGVANPNSRPRAEDLSATCCSMALNNIKPDPELWKQIRMIYEGLGKPW